MPFAITKSIFASRTFWVNLITTVIAVLALVGGQEWIAEYPKVTAGIAVVVGALNIVLRYLTVDAVKILAVILAVGALSLPASPAQARPIRVCDGTACKVTQEPEVSSGIDRWFKAMPLPRIVKNKFRAMFGVN